MVRISFLTCVLLIGLRLVIGWHFFFEGLYKVRSNEISPPGSPPAEIFKQPFSSAGYFAEAEGPLGPKIREWIGDPDSATLAKLKVAGGDKPHLKMPEGLRKEWEDYGRQFEAFYKLNDEEKKLVAARLEEAEGEYVDWLTGAVPQKKDGREKLKKEEPKKTKKTIVSDKVPVTYEVDDDVPLRVRQYQKKLEEIRDYYEKRLTSLGNVEKFHPQVRAMKADAATMRSDLNKDIDEQTKRMKDSLAKIVAGRLAGFDAGTPEDPTVDDRVLALVKLKERPAEANPPPDKLVDLMPAALDQQWNDYLAYVREYGRAELRKSPEESGRILKEAKVHYVRFLLDLDPFQGGPLPDKTVTQRVAGYEKAIAAARRVEGKMKKDASKDNAEALAKARNEPARYRQEFIDDVKRHTDSLRQDLGGFAADKAKGFDNYAGTIEPEKEKTHFLWMDWPTTRLEWLDWSVRWGMIVAGGCVLVGLFTRLACLGCVAFLVVEFLSNSPFPWLPTSPKSEGNYVFVNKNIVEMMALLVLATLPTGRWLGLDALLSRCCPFRGKSK